MTNLLYILRLSYNSSLFSSRLYQLFLHQYNFQFSYQNFFFKTELIITFLVQGIKRKNPKVSVMKPGNINKHAAKAIDAPETISKSGISFLYILITPALSVLRPCNFAKYIPMIAVKNISKIVLIAPTFWPILIITNISIAGIPIKIIILCSFVRFQIILIMYIYQIMSNNFGYLDIILLAMIAGFIILRLRNILGRRTGHQDKVYSNFSEKEFDKFKEKFKSKTKKSQTEFDKEQRKEFLKGAEIAYETIINSFAKGDKKSLEDLLTKEMRKNFETAIEERNKNNIKSELTLLE